MDLYSRIQELCSKAGISISELEKEIGIGNRTIYNWKNVSPSIDKVERIADYFNVDIDYILGRNNESDDDQIKFALFGGEEEITDEQYEEVKQFAQFIRERDRLKQEKEPVLYAARGRKDEDIIEDVAMRFDEALRKERDSKNTPK